MCSAAARCVTQTLHDHTTSATHKNTDSIQLVRVSLSILACVASHREVHVLFVVSHLFPRPLRRWPWTEWSTCSDTQAGKMLFDFCANGGYNRNTMGFNYVNMYSVTLACTSTAHFIETYGDRINLISYPTTATIFGVIFNSTQQLTRLHFEWCLPLQPICIRHTPHTQNAKVKWSMFLLNRIK